MRIYILILYLCGSYSDLMSQQLTAFKKSIIQNEFLYHFSEKEKFHILYKYDISSSKVDSFVVSYKSNPVFNDSFAKWQVKDTSLFYVRLYNGNDGMIYSQLRNYNINKLRTGEINETYLLSPETLFNNSLPIVPIYMKILHKMDASDGPIFFDFSIKNESLLLYVYDDDAKQLYVFGLSTSLPNDLGGELAKFNIVRPWKFVSQLSIDINLPFRVYQNMGKAYIVIDDGNIYSIDENKIKKEAPLPIGVERGMIVINKNNDTAYYIDTGKLFEKGDLTIKDKILKFGTKIFETK